MAKYYIDGTNGSDSNNGTSSTTAWLTLSKWKTAVLDDAGLLSRPNDEVVISGEVYEPIGVVINFASYGAATNGGVTFRQWLPSDGYPTGGTDAVPGISKAVLYGANKLTTIAPGSWSTAGAAGRRQITLSASTAIQTLVWKYGQRRDTSGRFYGHFYKCSADGSGAAADGVYDSAANASGKLDGFYQTGTTLTIDSTFVGTPTTADFLAAYDLSSPIMGFQNANNCRVLGIEFRISINRTNGAYAISFQSCTNCWAYDCVSNDSGHHSFGISNGTAAGSNCGFIRCCGMGYMGLDSGSAIQGGFGMACTNVNGFQTGALVKDCEFHIYPVLSPQVNSTTGQAYPTFRSTGDYTGTPSRTGGMVFIAYPYSTTVTEFGAACSNIEIRNCLFRMYWDALGASSTQTKVFNGGTNGIPVPTDPTTVNSYQVRFYDCQFVEGPQIDLATIRNMAFVRCRFNLSRVSFNSQATIGAINIPNYSAAAQPNCDNYNIFEACDIDANLYHATAATYLIYHNGGGAALAKQTYIRFRNCRVMEIQQRNATSARNSSTIYPGPNGGIAQVYLEFKYCELGFENVPPTNVTNKLTISDGASSYSNGKLVFTGNLYRNISSGNNWSNQDTAHDSAAEWLNRSTGIDTTGVSDAGVGTFNLSSWGGPLGGAALGYNLSSSSAIAAPATVVGLQGNASTGAVGPWQFGSNAVIVTGLRTRFN